MRINRIFAFPFILGIVFYLSLVSWSSAHAGETCHQQCDATELCEQQDVCTPQTDCSWKTCWWGWTPYPCEQCTTSTSCTLREVCTGEFEKTNCRQECTESGLPSVDNQPLLNALNIWSTAQIQSELGLSQAVAATITQRRIDNGGVFFTLSEAITSSFNPYDHTDKISDSEQTLHKAFAPKISYGNTVELWIDGTGNLQKIIDLIDSAESYVHGSVMLWYDDAAGRALAEAVKRAAERNVEVRILYDFQNSAFSSSKFTTENGSATKGSPFNNAGEVGVRNITNIIRSGCQAGIPCSVLSTSHETYYDEYFFGLYGAASAIWYAELYAAERELWPTEMWNKLNGYWWGEADWWQYDGWRKTFKDQGVPEYMLQIQDYKQLDIEVNLNSVVHQKYLIVDGKQALIGSSNFTSNYLHNDDFTQRSEGWYWRDGMALVKGPMVNHIHEVFFSQWRLNGMGDSYAYASAPYAHSDADLIQSNGSDIATMLQVPGAPFQCDDIESSCSLNVRYYTERMKYATGEFLIENPYVTDAVIWSTLNNIASNRASKITVLTPILLNDSPGVEPAVQCRGKAAAEAGVQIYDFYGGERFSHLKIAVDEDAGIVHYGSANLNSRSRLHDDELTFLVRNSSLAGEVKTSIENMLPHSTLKDDLSWYNSASWTTCTVEDTFNWLL